MPATITDHEAYVDAVWRAIPDAHEYWTWSGDPRTVAEEELAESIEISDASLAMSWFLDTVDPGRGGIVTFPDGSALGWHETGGWVLLDEDGPVCGATLPADASPAEVARRATAI